MSSNADMREALVAIQAIIAGSQITDSTIRISLTDFARIIELSSLAIFNQAKQEFVHEQ